MLPAPWTCIISFGFFSSSSFIHFYRPAKPHSNDQALAVAELDNGRIPTPQPPSPLAINEHLMFGLLPAAFRAFLKWSGASTDILRKKMVNLKLKELGWLLVAHVYVRVGAQTA